MWLLCILFWVLTELFIFLPIYLLGLILVPFLAHFTHWELGVSRSIPPRRIWTWRQWAWLWGNDDDGICPMEMRPTVLNAVKWYIRNPVENLRYTAFGLRITPRKVIAYGNVRITPDVDYKITNLKTWRWCAVRQGIKGGVWIQGPVGTKRLNLRFGYKLIPQDSISISPEDGRLSGCGTAAQIQLMDW
jgi:hypothetical protein